MGNKNPFSYVDKYFMARPLDAARFAKDYEIPDPAKLSTISTTVRSNVEDLLKLPVHTAERVTNTGLEITQDAYNALIAFPANTVLRAGARVGETIAETVKDAYNIGIALPIQAATKFAIRGITMPIRAASNIASLGTYILPHMGSHYVERVANVADKTEITADVKKPFDGIVKFGKKFEWTGDPKIELSKKMGKTTTDKTYAMAA